MVSRAKQIAKEAGAAFESGTATTKRAARQAERRMIKKVTGHYVRRGRRQGAAMAGMGILVLIGAIAAFFPKTAQRLLSKFAHRRERITIPSEAAGISRQEQQPGDRRYAPAYPDDGSPATAEHEVGALGIS